MRIPERAKPPKGGDRTATDGNSNSRGGGPAHWRDGGNVSLKRANSVAAMMRKAPAPGAKVAAVLGRTRNGCRLTIPPTPSCPGTEGVAERMLVNAPSLRPEAVRKS